MHRDGKDIDMVTVADRVRDLKKESSQSGLDVYYITGLPEKIPTTSNIESYAKIVWEKFIKRQTIRSDHNLYNTGFDSKDKAVENSFYSKIATCVCTGCDVDYTPGAVKSFYDGSPTQITMNLSFKETELLTKQLIDKGY